ncbi:DUF4235 domain-containing protein [Dermatobacter hominis]|uniref:DUF4235 domain-containing protein n=1 Tax=Dermatobacter hominis TaxID=2884263 RepID=UPI001D11F27D|nr:DUF4235 domain-containing protein [Dermatobacter hominis]UDY35194.1 DUF4235 domain-containing protein [Dermatobacter hominis]
MHAVSRLRSAASDPDSTTAKVGWRLVSTGTGILAGLAAQRAVSAVWSRLTPSRSGPPADPADKEVGWGEAVAWSVAAGVGVGVARLIGARVAARGWELAVGAPPPGVRLD